MIHYPKNVNKYIVSCIAFDMVLFTPKTIETDNPIMVGDWVKMDFELFNSGKIYKVISVEGNNVKVSHDSARSDLKVLNHSNIFKGFGYDCLSCQNG